MQKEGLLTRCCLRDGADLIVVLRVLISFNAYHCFVHVCLRVSLLFIICYFIAYAHSAVPKFREYGSWDCGSLGNVVRVVVARLKGDVVRGVVGRGVAGFNQ